MELRRYWQIFWKRRIWAALVFVAIMAMGGLITWFMPLTYQSSSKLLVEGRDKTLSAIGPDMGERTRLSALTLMSSPLDTQAEVVKSTPVVASVIAALNLRDPATHQRLTPTEFLAQGKVLALRGTDVLQLSYRNKDPQVARNVVAAWTKRYLAENRSAHRIEASATVGFIGEQLKKTKKDLAVAETALRNYKQTHGTMDLSEEAKVSVQGLSGLEAEYRQAIAVSQETAARVRGLRRQIGLNPAQAIASSAASQDPTMVQVRQQLLEAELSPLLSNAALGADHPEVKAQRARVAQLRKQLARRAEELVGSKYSAGQVVATLDPLRQDLTKTLAQAEIDALGSQTRVDTLKRLVGTFNGRLTHLPARELALTQLTRQAAVSADLYKMLLTRHQEARIQTAMSLGNVRVIEPATLPDAPISPILMLNMAVALLVGLVCGVGITQLLEYLDDTIQSLEDAESVLNVPTLGLIPWVRSAKLARLIIRLEPRSPAAESYRTLRTNIRFLLADGLKALSVTSVAPGEGKSTTVANLAIAFADTGKRVVVVDADLRKPSQHALFALPNNVGLSDLLVGDTTLENALQRSQGVDVLTSGPLPPNPAELFERPEMVALIQALKERYDMVLFDTPPVLPVADAAILSGNLDGLILLLGVNRATAKAARRAFKLLRTAKVKVWGTVVRGLRPDHDGYYQNFYHAFYGHVEKQRQRAIPALPQFPQIGP